MNAYLESLHLLCLTVFFIIFALIFLADIYKDNGIDFGFSFSIFNVSVNIQLNTKK